MNRPLKKSDFAIFGRAAAPEVMNVSIRVDDRAAFMGIIDAREKLFERKIDQFIAKGQGAARLAEQTANCALDAFITMSKPNPDQDEARAQLELTAAMAIAALGALKGKS